MPAPRCCSMAVRGPHDRPPALEEGGQQSHSRPPRTRSHFERVRSTTLPEQPQSPGHRPRGFVAGVGGAAVAVLQQIGPDGVLPRRESSASPTRSRSSARPASWGAGVKAEPRARRHQGRASWRDLSDEARETVHPHCAPERGRIPVRAQLAQGPPAPRRRSFELWRARHSSRHEPALAAAWARTWSAPRGDLYSFQEYAERRLRRCVVQQTRPRAARSSSACWSAGRGSLESGRGVRRRLLVGLPRLRAPVGRDTGGKRHVHEAELKARPARGSRG